uniref:Serine-threonine/tyrosine-protein kinase catalytic domain-containing protein n=1 Tax=Lactuca sativa TaxID=4236 RepID=A0A9R1VJM9_LACSA|nr:hypothetical protein LSAT_V11C500250570 [Lactuca sativa]
MKNIILKETNIIWLTHDSISTATYSFLNQNNIRKGGFGLRIKEFEHEIKAILNAKHTNVVLVRGYYVHGKELMSVYEYMHNMSLVYHLYGKKKY